jgi:hypothetical protein
MTMLRRLFLSALFGLTVLAAQPVLAQPPAKAGPRTYSVYYHGKGKADWHLFGHYATDASAKAVIQHLRGHGFETDLRVTNTPIPKIAPRKPSPALPANQTVTLAKAKEEFKLMAGQKDIAFRYPIDGCYARAELMIERMRQRGLYPSRVWSVANGEELYAVTKNVKKGYVTWSYHVAPILRVRVDASTQRWYVIDPSLFTQPVLIEQWERAQMRPKSTHTPYITVTRVGEAPVWVDHKRKPGTGYWPGADPSEGLHNHAVTTMKAYKALEGRVDLGAPVRGPGAALVWEAPADAAVLLRRRLTLAA